MQFEIVVKTIIDFIILEVNERKAKGVVVGLSGGLDSAVATTLAVKALGSSHVFALILPDSPITPTSDVEDAKKLAKILKIKYKIIEIGKTKNQFLRQLPKNKLAKGNFASRLRMCILYYYAGIMNYLVLGTTDKSEQKLGYYTKHGDGAADIFPIADLYKTEVREMARYLQLSSVFIEKKSSPRIWKGQTAESEIGLTYEEIDNVLKNLVDNDTLYKSKINAKKVAILTELMDKNSHKQQMGPLCKISYK